ncbi:MAG: phosphate/phosphite/phosphonate ABC transporter substrate-binding protein [Acetobacteraceae bacterium]
MSKFRVLALATALSALAPVAMAAAPDCPNGGTVRFGVEPFEAAARLIPIFTKIGDALATKIDCKVQVIVTTNYSAEIEAMRNNKLEMGEFGPLGYVLAHQVANAQAVAAYAGPDGKPDMYTAGIVTWPGSGITKIQDVAGKTFAYSDPASTSGHLFPATELKKVGIDPDTGIKPLYAGSHTATFETIRNHKVQVGELNSSQINAATVAGEYKPADFVELWRSEPIPNDPIAVWGGLQPGFKARLTTAIQSLDFTSILTKDELKIVGSAEGHMVPQVDSAFDPIRELVSVLHLDLAKLNE